MSEKKWSKGPWGKDKYGFLCDADGRQIMEYNSGIASAGLPTAEYKANAKLRNAAPDLYEALEAWDEHDRGLQFGVLSLEKELRLLTRARELTQAALRKADGV